MSKSRHIETQPYDMWSIIVSAWLIFVVFTGGTSIPSPTVLTAHAVVGFLIIILAAWRLRLGLPSKLAAIGLTLALFSFCLVGSHLLPLPPELWTNLPGRELVVNTIKFTNESTSGWKPFSLVPVETKIALLDMLPSFACFIAILSVHRKNLPLIGFVLLFSALVCVFIGLLQRNAPESSFLHFQGYLGPGKALGTFSNPNYFAIQLYSSLPFLAALAMTIQEKYNVRGWLVLVFALVYGAIILVGLAIVGSRAGIVMAMLSTLLSVLFVYRSRFSNTKTRFSAVPLIVLGVVLIFGQVGMIGILQLAGTDPLLDYRSTIFDVSYQAAKTFFPYGSGFGSFVPVYQLFETPDTIIANYVNHAHNDWLELALEGGLPAVILLVLFLLLVLASLVSIIQLAYENSGNSYARAAGVSLVLILLHAVVDFGLRTPAISAIAATCFGIMVCARASQPATALRRSVENRVVDERTPIRPFSKPARAFKTQDATPKAEKQS